jgi:hypothetical protein
MEILTLTLKVKPHSRAVDDPDIIDIPLSCVPDVESQLRAFPRTKDEPPKVSSCARERQIQPASTFLDVNCENNIGTVNYTLPLRYSLVKTRAANGK